MYIQNISHIFTRFTYSWQLIVGVPPACNVQKFHHLLPLINTLSFNTFNQSSPSLLRILKLTNQIFCIAERFLESYILEDILRHRPTSASLLPKHGGAHGYQKCAIAIYGPCGATGKLAE